MSSQRGNVSRTRKQKYQNNKAFKNDLHDTSHTTKAINSIAPDGLCHRCKEIIEWKIKYKKYKPLSQPATCIRCHGKNVLKAYYNVCSSCAKENKVCAKCNTKQEIVLQPGPSQQEKSAQDSQLKFELQQLKERQRRAFFRHVEKGEEPSKVLNAAGVIGDDSFDESEASNEESFDQKCEDGINDS